MLARIARALAWLSPPFGLSVGTFAATREMLRKQAPVIHAVRLRKHSVVFDRMFIAFAPLSSKDPAANGDNNGAGPQKIVTACGNPSDPSTCGLITVPTGGPELLILNSEFRIPIPIKKGLSFATFYDGGNVFDRIGFKNFSRLYSNSVGFGLRYTTPVGPIRFDVGHNLSPTPGISATQIFLTIGQAF